MKIYISSDGTTVTAYITIAVDGVHVDPDDWPITNDDGFELNTHPSASKTVTKIDVGNYKVTWTGLSPALEHGDIIEISVDGEIDSVAWTTAVFSHLVQFPAKPGDEMDLIDAPNETAIAAIKSGLSTLDAAGVRTAVGLAEANLDTQIGAVLTSSAFDSRLSSTRAGYIDKLNISGLAASQADVQGITVSSRVRLTLPPFFERPDSGSLAYRVWLYHYGPTGQAEDLDTVPTFATENNTGTDRSANLGTPTKLAETTGIYYVDYTVADDHAIEGLVFKADVTEDTITTRYAAATIIVDTTAVDFTAADRSKLDAVHSKLPTSDYLAGSENIDGSIEVDADVDLDPVLDKLDAMHGADPGESDTIEGIKAVVDALNTGEGNGANELTITVEKDSEPVESLSVRIRKGAEVRPSRTTNASGITTYNLDAGTWVLNISHPLYVLVGASGGGVTFDEETQTVEVVIAGTGPQAVTLEVESVAVEPSLSGLVTGVAVTVDNAGEPEQRVVQVLRIQSGGSGRVWAGGVRSVESDAAGFLQIPNLTRGGSYLIGTQQFQIPRDAVSPYTLPDTISPT